jgi:hypothetical protein
MRHIFTNKKRKLMEKELALEKETNRLEMLRDVFAMEKENRFLSDLNKRLKSEREFITKENNWFREKSALEIEKLKITEIDSLKQELAMLKKAETIRSEMLERLLKEKDAEIQRFADFVHAGKIPLTFTIPGKSKHDIPYDGEEILVSNDKKDWCLRKFHKFDKDEIYAHNISIRDLVKWKYWKFPD